MATTRPPTKRPAPKSGRSRAQERRGGPAEATFDEPTPAERRSLDEEQSRPYKEAYEAGRKEGRQQPAKTSGGGRKPASRPGARTARRAARELAAPVRAQISSGVRIFSMTLAIVALYDILTGPGPEAFSGFIGGISKALDWIAAPTPIPAKKH